MPECSRFLYVLLATIGVWLAVSHIVSGTLLDPRDLDDKEAAYEFALPLQAKRASLGVDMCGCCATKQLSLCCSRCLEQNSNKPAPPSTKYPDILHRLGKLKQIACTCCHKSGDRHSKCCDWCIGIGGLISG